MKQRQIILAYLEDRYPNWIPSYILHGLETPDGYIGSRGERNCRDMRSEGILESKIIGRFVYYRPKKEVGQGKLL